MHRRDSAKSHWLRALMSSAAKMAGSLRRAVILGFARETPGSSETRRLLASLPRSTLSGILTFQSWTRVSLGQRQA